MQKLPNPVLKVVPGGLWELHENYSFRVETAVLGTEKVICATIPAGFKTDLDSVPRVPVLYEIYKGRTRIGALVHDYLYQLGCQKAASDLVFLHLMKHEGVRRYYRYPIYWAVFLFGGFRYKRARHAV